MPHRPDGSGEFEYEKNRPRPKYKSTGSEEELGDMHLSTENYSVALEYYEQTLQKIHQTTPNEADLVRLYRKISDCYRKKGLLREAMAFLRTASSHCEEEDEIGRGTILCRHGIILYDSGRNERALREALAAYRILRTSDEHKEVANAQLLIANCYARSGKQSEAEQFFLDALSSYRRIGDTVGESFVLNNLGLFHKNACRWGRALHFLNRALEICNEVGLTHHRVRVTLNLGIVHMKKRDFAAAESAFKQARQMAERTGDDLKYAKSTLMLGVTETKKNNFTAAEKHLMEARVIAERRGYGRELLLADEFLGDLSLGRGDLESARENYMAACTGARKSNPDGDIVAEVLRRLIHVDLLEKKFRQAIESGAEALKVARACGELHEIGFIERTIGLAHAMLKERDDAEEHINSSFRIFLEVNNPYEANRSAVMLAEYMLRYGDRQSAGRARMLAGESLSFFERNEEYGDLAETHLLLARIENELRNRDDGLLHLFEAQRLADDLKDRNLLRRVRRMRKKIERDTTGRGSEASPGLRVSREMAGFFAGDPHLRSYLDYFLVDLMRKLTVGHGFVAISGGGNGSDAMVLACRGVDEHTTRELTNWFLSRESGSGDSMLVTDAARDRRLNGARALLPGGDAPVYFHPLARGGRTFGLLFFQADGSGPEPVGLGSSFDIVSTYAGFIGFLVGGMLDGGAPASRQLPTDTEAPSCIITRNAKMFRMLSLAERVAVSDSTVLLTGETGTGKGLVARTIHNLSRRSDGKFIHVNCAALPEGVLESELFGHVKGAFTGAIADKKGLLAEANGGTVFLDEIGKTSLPIQGKLLQFLDTRQVRPVGSNEMHEVDVRLVFASKTDLMTLCREGRMLEDFFYRINDFPLRIPPLRERVDDVMLLADHYLRLHCEEMEKTVLGFSDEAVALLRGMAWPGNVRELEKIVNRAVILCDDNAIVTPAELVDADDRSVAPGACLADCIRDLERRMIAESLDRHSWNRRASAASLGISYPTLLKKIRLYGLES
ncbi:MAG: sigma 54-interacting transcriptional regulator [Candidatus Krumholzibacteriota bacterium]|nr:sigma 54-interacting transcriptional regulator [Candidatus Krumholzibacteriota bacterium]